MPRTSIRLHGLCIALACGAGSCHSASAPPAAPAPATVASDAVVSYRGLVDRLRHQGGTVEPGRTIEQPFFGVRGRLMRLDGSELQVYEYRDDDDARADAAKVSPTGGSIGTFMASWMAPPHFFKGSRLIVLYVGSDPAVLEALQRALGSQFAGR